MKKIAILISGQIRIFEKNISFLNDLKNNLSDYEITVVSTVWENQNEIDSFKKKYENIFKSEEIKHGSFWNARHRLMSACYMVGEEDRRVKPGFGAWIWQVIEGENKGKFSYCYIGNDNKNNWEVRFLNKSTQFILET